MQTALDISPARPGDGVAGPRQFLHFALAEATFAVPIDQVREILEVGPTTVMPLMPAFVRGVMNLRGSVVPVIDMAARFGMPGVALGRRSCIVVVEAPAFGESATGPQVLGMLVDAVHEVQEAGELDIEPAPTLGTRISAHFIAGITRSRGAMVTVIDLARALESDELARMIAADTAH
jgi:purine-binding chemotaxis protein CheW